MGRAQRACSSSPLVARTATGQADLYVSFRADDGAWTKPMNLGPAINSEHTDFCPMGTWDGRYLFFSRRVRRDLDETTAGDVYWVDAAVLDRFRP